MEVEIDHYEFLGLPTGEEGANLTVSEITKAYKLKALELHPDKRRNDPNATLNFLKLKSSFDILKDDKARKLFDDLLRVKREQLQRQSQYDSKRRKMVSDLHDRERGTAFDASAGVKAKEEEERMIVSKFREEIARIRAMHANDTSVETTTPSPSPSDGLLDGDKVLKVSWEGNAGDYSEKMLKELFNQFGQVEDIVFRSSMGGAKRKRSSRSALVVMATKDAAVSAMGSVCGHLSNPLLVMPLHKAAAAPPQPTVFSSPFPARHVEPDEPVVSKFVGASYHAKEASILDKLRKAAEKQK